jgi:hypothetical protein
LPCALDLQSASLHIFRVILLYIYNLKFFKSFFENKIMYFSGFKKDQRYNRPENMVI